MRMALELALHNPVCAASLWELMHCDFENHMKLASLSLKEVRSHGNASWL